MNAASSSSANRWFAVVPAAGRSVRMGTAKLLLPWNGGATGTQTLIEHVLATWHAASPTAIVVTVHPDDAELAELCRRAGAEVVQPPAPPPDMKASIAAAVEYLRAQYAPNDADAWLVAPADLPELSPRVIEQLLHAYDRARPAIVRPIHAGRHGHPTLLPWSCAAELTQIPSARGLDFLFERLPFSVVEAGPECLADDVDTPADYRRLRDR